MTAASSSSGTPIMHRNTCIDSTLSAGDVEMNGPRPFIRF